MIACACVSRGRREVRGVQQQLIPVCLFPKIMFVNHHKSVSWRRRTSEEKEARLRLRNSKSLFAASS